MKTVESTPIKIVLAAVSIATIGIVGLAITAPAHKAPQQIEFECRIPIAAPQPPPPPEPQALPDPPLAVTST